MRIGIQGGPGSFNDQALAEIMRSPDFSARTCQVQYLYTSARVLHALSEREIDFGLIAVSNSLSGAVLESLKARELYDSAGQFQVTQTVRLKIEHCLLASPAVKLEDLKLVMTHPQVIAQCQKTFSSRFPDLQMRAGRGDLSDPSRLAQALLEGKIPAEIGTISSARIAEIFNLQLLAEDLQDSPDNFTDFELLSRV